MLGTVQTVIILFSAIYLLLIFLIFITKKRIANTESSIYRNLIVINLFTILLEISLFFLSKVIFMKAPWDIYATPIVEGVDPSKKFIFLMISKIFISLVILWFVNIFKYIFYLCHKNSMNNVKIKKIFNIISIVYIFVIAIVLLLPIEYVVTQTTGSADGPAVKFAMVWIVFILFTILFYILANFKKLEIKKMIPLVTLILLMAIAIVIQMKFPELLVFNPVITFITIFMYHTIENPDLKVINELYRNKELVEQNYEDKYNFLFEITGEAKRPLNDINKLCGELKKEDDPLVMKQGLMLINNMVSQLNFTINNILDISMMDAHKIKFIDTKYDLGKFCNDIVTQIKANLTSSLELKVSLPNKMPILYGDYLKLRQILYSLIITPARDKKNSVIQFKVDLIERFDVCRVIFTIIADKSNISIEDINNILSATGEFSQNDLYNLEKKELDMVLCQKVIKVMGGNLMIKSNKTGTEIKLVIDQKTYQDNSDNILAKYLDEYIERKRVLIITQDKQLVDTMKKYLDKNTYSVFSYLYGKDAIDRIKLGRKFDYIFVSDNMNKMSGLEVLKELKEITNFNTPVYILINSNNENLEGQLMLLMI